MFRVGLLILCFVVLTSWCFAQDDRTTIKKSLIPATGSDTRDFIPSGWKAKVFMDDVDHEKLEEGAVKRLGLG